MIRIALCDDVSVQLSMVNDIVDRYCRDNKIEAEIHKFLSGEQLLGDVEKNGFFDLYVLDMIMPGIRGIELGQVLREKGDRGKIIYLTATSEYAVESYEVDAFFYLLKPISKSNLYKVLDKAIVEISPVSELIDDRKIEIKTREGGQLVCYHDIAYVDIVNRGLCYHMMDNSELEGPMLRIPFAEGVKQLAESGSFVFAGSYMLVNAANVDKADKNSVTFKNGIEMFPSKTAAQQLYEQLKSM